MRSGVTGISIWSTPSSVNASDDRVDHNAECRCGAALAGRPARAAPHRHSALWSTRSSDALTELGVDHIEMPVTPERIWRAIRGKPQRSRRSPGEMEQERVGPQVETD